MHAPKQNPRISFQRLAGSRIVANSRALDAISWPADAISLRFAPDEVYITPPLAASEHTDLIAADPHAVILSEGAFSGAWIEEDRARRLLEHYAEWEMPARASEPRFAQGSVAGVATKIYFADGMVLFLVQTPYAHELEERLT